MSGGKTDNIDPVKQWEEACMTLAADAARRHIPLSGAFELTPRCNLKCKMCYVRLDRAQIDKIGRELSASEWISLGEEALGAGTLYLLLTGGEPLLRPDFEEIYAALSEMGFIITLNTNATLITPAHVRLFSKYPPTLTAVTLYGACPETYEKVSGSADGFDKAIRGLELLSGLPTALKVRTTLIRDNVHELEKLRAIAKRYSKSFGIDIDVFKAVRGAKSEAESCRLTPKQIVGVMKASIDHYRSNTDQDPDADRPDREILREDKPKHNTKQAALSCLAAKSSYWISWDGRMLPCCWFSEPYTLPLSEGFASAWNRLPSLLHQISLPSKCAGCEHNDASCEHCPAQIQAETGCFDKPSPYICAVAEERSRLLGT